MFNTRLIMVAGGALLCLSPLTTLPTWAQRSTDQQVELRIEQQLAQCSRMAHLLAEKVVHWRVNSGVVTLSGTVPSYGLRDQLQHKCEQVAGVTKVDNRLLVAPPLVDDATLADKIRQDLQSHDVENAKSVCVAVREGVVTLQGGVSSPSHKHQIEMLVQAVPGLIKLNSELRVAHVGVADTARCETELLPDIQSLLQATDPASELHAKVTVEGGRVVVHDSLSLATIQSAVNSILVAETEQVNVVAQSGPDAQSGHYELTGSVQSLAQKYRVLRLVKALSLVRPIGTGLVVEPVHRDDQQLQQELQHLIAGDSRLQEADVQVSVSNSRAMVTGTVQDFNSKLRIWRLAQEVVGLADVVNSTTVAWSPKLSDDGLKNALEKRLQGAGLSVQSVQVEQGVATLSGELDARSLAQVLELAQQTDGLRSVRFVAP